MTRIWFALVLAIAAPAAADSKAVTITDKEIVLSQPIYFATGKAEIKSESLGELDALAAALVADRHITLLEIGVHSDERGDATWNRKLTQQRADAIMQYLVDKGADPKRLRATGYGETKPLDKHHNEKAWAKNRRTELLILQRVS